MLRRFVFVTVLSLMFAPMAAEAFSVQPAVQEIEVRAGERVQRQVTVSNPESDPVELFFTVQKFVAAGGGAPQFLAPSDTAGLPEWVRVSTPKVTLKGGESRTIQVDIRPPANEVSRGHSVALFATEVPPEGGNVQVAKRIATLWFVTVQGRSMEPAMPKWEVSLGDIQVTSFGWKTEASAVWTIKNTGAAHGIAVVSSKVRDVKNTLMATTTVMRLLPGEEREGNVVGVTHWPINRFTFELVDPSGQTFVRQRWVIAISGWAMLVVAFVGTSALIWRWSKRRRRGILSS